MESNFASLVSNCTPQALDTFKRAHAMAVNNLDKANDHVRAANEGKQKLVDNEKKAKSNLSAEKKKTAQLTKENTSLKRQLTKEKNKNKGKKGGSKDNSEEDEGQEVARMQDEIDGLQGELDKANNDIRDLRQKLQDNEVLLSSTQQNLEDTVSQLSELKSRNVVLTGLETGQAPTLDEEKQALQKEVSQLKQEVKDLKLENISLNKQLTEANSTRKKNAPKDQYADMRNEDVNKSIKSYIYDTLSRNVVFVQTEEMEINAHRKIWDALKTKLKLDTYHNLDFNKFSAYYGPAIKSFIGSKRTDLQAAMKRAARGKFWARRCAFRLNAPSSLLTYGCYVLHLVTMGRKVSLNVWCLPCISDNEALTNDSFTLRQQNTTTQITRRYPLWRNSTPYTM